MPARGARMPISVASPAPRRHGLANPLRALVRAAVTLEGRRPGEITVVLERDARLRELNRRFRGLDRATDVLAFDYAPAPRAAALRGAKRTGSPPRAPVSGDILVSLDRMEAQAKRFRVTRGRELARLVVHGALHLAGLDHHAPAERARMRRGEALALRACAAQIRALERALDRAARVRNLPERL